MKPPATERSNPFATLASHKRKAELQLKNDIDLLILGAGISGLIAARALAERGVRVCVLEAKQRVGGRIMSQKVEGGGTAELGAEFIHGRAPELWALIDEVGAKTVERHGSMLREERAGGLVEDDPQDNTMFEPLEQLENFAGEDQTFADWLAASDVDNELRPALTAYVEGFNAADAQRISVRSLGVQQKAEDATEGDRSWQLPGGYAQLPDYLAARLKELGGEIHLDCEVLNIRWNPRNVAVVTTHGELTAPQCIVTFPLGVLHKVNRPSGIQITPEPAAIAQARRLAMGHASRFTMIFRSPYWQLTQLIDQQTVGSMSFLFTSNHIPPVWWTSHPDPNAFPALTGWVGGPRASALEGKTPEQLGSDACATLAKVFAIDEHLVRSALVATYSHDWSADPFALGVYSYVPVGAIDASAAMTQPEADTIFFAGEHTDITGNWGTVHAAIRSGLRAAAQILKERATT
jgi:monoamine oxidase